MRNLWLLIAALIVALLIACLLLLRCCQRVPTVGGVGAAEDCSTEAHAPYHMACIAVGVVTASVWDDGTVTLAIPLYNDSETVLTQVRIETLSFGSGSRSEPAALPVGLGDIAPEQRAVLNSHFSQITTPGTYEMRVTGSLLEEGTSRTFNLRETVSVAISTDDTAAAVSTTLPRQVTPGTRLPPVKIQGEHDNPNGPPIPDGPSIMPYPAPPKTTGAASAAGASAVTFIRDTSGTESELLAPLDPATAAGGGLVLSTGNLFLSLSTDDGVNFTDIDPTTIFPAADGGLCCDQVVLYDPSVNLFFWLLQYSSLFNTLDPSKPGPNRLRLAWATPESIKSNSSLWSFVDLQSQVLLKTPDQALDYPDLAITNGNLYVSVDALVSRSIVTGFTTVDGLIVARLPLSHFTNGGTTVGVSWIGPDQSSNQKLATAGRLTQSSADVMYWAGHVDPSKVKVFRWPDASNKANDHNVKVNTWCRTVADYASVAPDGVQWIDTTRANLTSVLGAARRPTSDPGQNHGEVWLAWNAGKDDATGKCSLNRPQPYVKILRVNDQNLDGIGEYHIWNSGYAFAYPALATSTAGEVGVSVPYGGASDFPTSTVGFLGDFELFYVESSNVTLSVDGGTRIGDFYTVRNSGPMNADLSSEGYALRLVNSALSKTCTTTPGCIYHPHYIQWGRPPVVIQ